MDRPVHLPAPPRTTTSSFQDVSSAPLIRLSSPHQTISNQHPRCTGSAQPAHHHTPPSLPSRVSMKREANCGRCVRIAASTAWEHKASSSGSESSSISEKLRSTWIRVDELSGMGEGEGIEMRAHSPIAGRFRDSRRKKSLVICCAKLQHDL